MPNPSPKPDPVDWKKALKKLADACDDSRLTDYHFCMICPAAEICYNDHNSDDHRCRRVIMKWARESF